MEFRYSRSRYDITPLSPADVEALATRLDPEAFRVTQRAGTEPPFCGTPQDDKRDGLNACVVCGLPLFSVEHKFTSNTGWPSFYREFDPAHVVRRPDHTHGMVRTELACARCGAHLGHVFDDGPEPTGERHCLNSAALAFHRAGAELPPQSRPVAAEVAYFAMHDPTQLDRQGADVGTQYRSGIWTVSEERRRLAEGVVRELEAADRFGGHPIRTRIEPAGTFWPAEAHHQDHVVKTGRTCHVSSPW